MRDVLIVGAGIAGLTLAYGLERAGHRPIVVEQSPQLRDAGYMLDFYGSGYDAAERLGLIPDLTAIDADLARMTFLRPTGREKFSLSMAAMRNLLDNRSFLLLRGDFERLLYQKIKDRVEVRFGTEVESFTQAGAKVQVSFSDGRMADCDLLVGADGVHSRIRRIAFGPEKSFARYVGYTAAAFIVEDAPGLADPRAFYTLTLPGRQVNVYPIPGGRWATLFLHRSKADVGYFSRDAACQELHRLYGDLGWIVPTLLERLDQAREVYFDRAEQIELPRWSDGRVTLVGDAAGCVSLLAGQGASLAVAGAVVLADSLDESDDLAGALARYEAQMRPIVTRAQDGGRRFARWFLPDSYWRIALRDLMMRLTAWPMAAPLLKRQFLFGETIKF